MRQKLNESPVAQVALIAVLAAVGAFLFLRMSGGDEETAESAAGPTVATVNGATAVGDTPGEAVEGAIAGIEAGASAAAELPSSVPVPPPPRDFTVAYESGETVVLLVVDDGDADRLTAAAAERISELPDVTLFRVPARDIARYAAVTVGLDVNRVPALVVMRPIDLSGGVPQGSVEYGFQTPQSAVQTVRDASYAGPEETYHPD